MSDPHKPGADAGPAHAPDLKKVNERLREMVASLRTERERLAADGRTFATTPHPSPSGPTRTPPPVAGLPSSLEPVDMEKKRLAAELALAKEAVAHANAERERLQQRLSEIEAENQKICDEYVAVQEKTTDLAELFVALERIHGGLSRGETLAALQEIVINVVGSEELAILERRGDRLVLVQSFGIDPERVREVPVGQGVIGRTAATGKLYVAGHDGAADATEPDLTACVPLRLGDEVSGVVAIYRLLGHKPGLSETDHAIFDLMTTHAGVALHLRELRDRVAAS
jgi:hypothetical protein